MNEEMNEEMGLESRAELVQIYKEGTTIKELRAARDACRTGGKGAQNRLLEKADDVLELLQIITIHYSRPVNNTISPAEAEEERSAVRKLALAALQFLANLTAGNPRTASWVFQKSYDGRFLEYLETFSEDRDLLMCTCVIIHNNLACAVEKRCAVEKLLEDGALICKLMRILLPHSALPPTPSSSLGEEKNDPVFEWVYLVLLKILEAGKGKEAFMKTGLDEDMLQNALVLLEPGTEREHSPGYDRVMPHPSLLSVPPLWHGHASAGALTPIRKRKTEEKRKEE